MNSKSDHARIICCKVIAENKTKALHSNSIYVIFVNNSITVETDLMTES